MTEGSMTGREIATVRWGSPNSQASFYGTALTVKPSGEIHLVNHLMPSGTTIQEWYSFTDYQSVRDTPALPLLHHGKRYRIDPAIESDPPDSVIFDVRYFNRFNDLVGADVLHPPALEFEYPADECHHYTIRLVNAGCDNLSFTSFTLLEAAMEAEMVTGMEAGNHG
jgi:accessory secretory protein Asp3